MGHFSVIKTKIDIWKKERFVKTRKITRR